MLNQAIAVLLLTGQADLPHHNWRETTAAIRDLFHRDPRFDLRVLEDAGALTAETLSTYQTVLINYNGPRLSRPIEQALERFVRNGGGLVAFHHAAYGEWFGMELRNGKWSAGPTQGWEAFPKMIGASWQTANIGHARRWPFLIDYTSKAHPITEGLPAQWMANDELYHRLDLAPTAHVIADALSPKEIGGTGRREPLAWTNTFGAGRVFFTPLGHDAMAWHQPGMRQLFRRAVEWTATGQVTQSPPKSELKLLVVTGGHGYPTAFYAMLDSLEGVRWTHAANHTEAFARPLTGRYDVILLHDLYNVSTEQTRQRLREFVDTGNGVVSLHHAIVDYTDWPWWYEEVTGGKYFEKPDGSHPASSYREGVDFLVSAVKGKQNHPVLRGVGPLFVHDELYKNMWHSPRIEVLMETDVPDNDRPVVYIGPNQKARSIYIQLGHSAQTMENPGFRRLVRNALYWTARKEGAQ
ncbi:MAG: ThuA domain-containing protein [Acidobacteria bacterium]|nr:ThuA domain-containing protein [Acidobacteriota bacterium]